MLFKEFHIWVFWCQNVGPCWVENEKKDFFIPAIFLPTQFCLKTKFLTVYFPSTLSKLKYELTDLHKILQKPIFTETNR